MRPLQAIAPSSAVLFVSILLGAVGCSRPPGPEAKRPAAGFVPDTKPVPAVRWVERTVPAGTAIRLALSGRLSLDSSRPGDAVRARVTEAVVQDGLVAVPAGSMVEGRVAEVVAARAGTVVGGGRFVLELGRIDTPTDATAALSERLTVTVGGRGVEPETPLTLELQEPLNIKVRN
jgi:hypothetical protein